MDALRNGLRNIQYAIPRELLNLVFLNYQKIGLNNLEEQILDLVIRPRVLMDMNIVGGITMFIHTNQMEIIFRDNSNTVFRIPKEVTGGKNVVNVLSAVNNVLGYQQEVFDTPDNGLMNKLNTHIDNYTENIYVTTNTALIGNNTLHVKSGMLTTDLLFKVMVDNDENLLNFNVRSYHHVDKLFVLAVKSFIYNTMIINAGVGVLYNGHELGPLQDVISSYSESEEEYLLYIKEVFTKVSYMNDQTNMHDFVRSSFGIN